MRGQIIAIEASMKYIMTTLFLITIAFTQACGKKPAAEEACHFQQNSYLQRVSWHRLPITLTVHSSLSVEQVEALREAVNIWNETRKSEWETDQGFFVISEKVHSGNAFIQDGSSVVSITTDWPEGALEQAETVLMWEGNKVVEADIRLNGNKPLSTSEITEPGSIDLVALYVHELGHVLGLLHIDGTEYSVMEASLERGTDKRRHIGKLELDALRCEY
jgi:hypothetical protein